MSVLCAYWQATKLKYMKNLKDNYLAGNRKRFFVT